MPIFKTSVRGKKIRAAKKAAELAKKEEKPIKKLA
jgi:hypothetical protein